MEFLLAEGAQPQGGGITMFLPMIVIFAIFWFLIIRPQSKQRKEHANMLGALKVGDKVLTRGGIYGKVVEVTGKDENRLVVEIANGVKIHVARGYVASLAENAQSTPVEQ